MGISLKQEHLKRYRDIARLLWKYGRADFVSRAGLEEVLTEEDRGGEERNAAAEEAQMADEFAADLENMGPVFVKLGQVLSSRYDLLPLTYTQALSRLQNCLEPFPFSEVEEIIKSELGVRLSKAFASFEEKPIGVASIGQVHRATLRDGRPVAVKIQRPGIRSQIADDLEALAEIAAFADAHTEAGKKYQFSGLLDEFHKNLIRELDFRQEARNLTEIRKNLQGFAGIVLPAPIPDYTTSRVLVMDYISGRKINDIGPLAHMEMEGEALADQLFRAYLQQVLVDGIFHADPHPGNVLVTNDYRLALIDLGMVGRLSSRMQERLLKLLIAVSEGNAEDAADMALKIGDFAPNFDEGHFRRCVTEMVAEQQGASVADIQIGKLLMRFSQISGESGIRMPAELTLFSKTLLNLDEIGRTLDPEFNPNEAIRRYAADIMRQRTLKTLSPGHIFSAALETQEFVAEMPRRINRILDLVSKNQMKIEVEAIDETTLIEGFQKVANRITMGLVLAALIIGAAMLMRVETNFRLFGYPGLAMICFLSAAGGGAWLLLSILMSDRADRAKKSS